MINSNSFTYFFDDASGNKEYYNIENIVRTRERERERDVTNMAAIVGDITIYIYIYIYI